MMAKKKNWFAPGTRIKIMGEPIIGTASDYLVPPAKTPKVPIEGFIYNCNEGGRGWQAMQSYFLTTPLLTGSVVLCNGNDVEVEIDSQFHDEPVDYWARNPYTNTKGEQNANITRCGEQSSLNDCVLGIERPRAWFHRLRNTFVEI